MFSRIFLLIFLVGLTGCGASEVMQSGPSTYEVRAQEGLLTGGWAQAQKDAIAKATEYCTSKGQVFTLQNSTQGGVPGWTPLSSTVTFTCGADFKAQEAEANDACRHEMESDDFAPLRSKMESTDLSQMRRLRLSSPPMTLSPRLPIVC